METMHAMDNKLLTLGRVLAVMNYTEMESKVRHCHRPLYPVGNIVVGDGG
jgi:hypothetical protein